MDKELKKALEDYAVAHDFYVPSGSWPDASEYVENDNPDADNGDAWLENRTSYIRRIGVLAVWDSNKTDYCSLVFGVRRHEDGEPKVIGHLTFDQGENCDVARTIDRINRLIGSIGHPVFWDR